MADKIYQKKNGQLVEVGIGGDVSPATSSSDGLMSAADKEKLDDLYTRCIATVSTTNSASTVSAGTTSNAIPNRRTTLQFNGGKGIAIRSSVSSPLHKVFIGVLSSALAGDGINVSGNVMSVPEYQGAAENDYAVSGLSLP